MIGTTETNSNHLKNWNKFSKHLWFDNELKIWLDISKIKFNEDQFNEFHNKFINVFNSINRLEKGEISNASEGRKVGHYWLRNTSIAPTKEIGSGINNQIESISSLRIDKAM